MQQLTKTLKDAIRGSYQVPLCKLEIFNRDGSFAGEILDVSSVSIDVAGSRKVLRTFSADLDNKDGKYTPDLDLHGGNLLWYNKTVTVYYGYKTRAGDEWLPQGTFTLDSIKPDVTPDGLVLEISGQDEVSKMIEDKFDDVYTVKDDLASESSNYAMSTGVTLTASSEQSGHEAAKAADSDVYVSHWRPAASDQDPWIYIYMNGIRTINVLYLFWGSNSFNYENRVNYFLEYSDDAQNWTRINDLNGLDENSSLFGDVEHCFDQVSCRYLRINILDWKGQIQLRHIKPQMITATQTVDKVIKDVALSAGITKTRIPVTRRWIKQKQAEIGDEKQSFCTDVSTSIGWVAPYMDEEGYYTTHSRDINPVDPAWSFDVDVDNIFSFSPRYTNDIYNVIVAVYKSSSEKAIVSRAIDQDPGSPTSIQELGRRVYKYENDLIDTQDKADQFAQKKLFERTRLKHQTSLPVTGHPGIQVDDVVSVRIPEAKITDVLYYITGYVTSFDAEGAQFDTRINISQL